MSRPVSGLLAKKNPLRPPSARPPTVRTQSNAPVLHSRTQSGAVSPAESVVSISTNTSHSRSPVRQNGGTKRKERDFDGEGGEETNIHVVVRCRGRSDREVRENSGVVVSTEGVKGKNVELSMGLSALSNKTYHFDKVFSPAADQGMIYEDVVTPLLDEMLQGYNCTIFAYGQTGTGKTYTMSGDMSSTGGLLSESAGIIPRVLHSLFGKLEADDAESSVKCSFIELYNEELRDLLAADNNTKLKIFEDGQKKGHSATLVQGMEESHIKSASAGIKLLQDGSFKRQVAATKCNDLSSRSHTVFTITVYIKRIAESGEEFVSAGKLNLVDLAGSENIQRSGAENKRAAEAGLINKSLLTLGRVINALVDRGSHIPYRESKLTRLLQDSLGGRTKTCIIATVSPAKSNLEETISTLDYAFRAKNIRNKPQVNQIVSKKTLLREFTAEIEKLKCELIATRQRNGVYLTNENFEEITVESESRRILSEEQKAKIETMEANLRNKVQELFSLTSNFTILKRDNEGTKQVLDETKGVLANTEFVLANTKHNLKEETTLRVAHQHTEEQLSNLGSELLSTLERTVSDVGGLHSKIYRKVDLHESNRREWQSAQSQVSSVTKLVESRIGQFQSQQEQLVSGMASRMQEFILEELQKLEYSQKLLQSKVDSFKSSEKEVNDQTSVSKEEMNDVLEEIKVLREDVKRKVGEGLNGLSAAAQRISAEVINELGGFHTQLHTSYSSLGRDFKATFEELVKHLNRQKAEVNNLKQQLSSAAKNSMQATIEISDRLEATLAKEKAKAAADRQQLLSQIKNLVNQSGETQDARWESEINAVRKDITSSRNTFEAAERKYAEGIDAWTHQENILVEEVMKSRDTLKGRMKKDWITVNEHNTSIQTTTKSVHEETVRIVDAQMKEMAQQMQALDDFVTRARSQNERHHEAHVKSLSHLGSNVHDSYSSIGDHFISTYDRIRTLGTDMSSQHTTLQASIPPLTENIQQPLSNLRNAITTKELREYNPTGETPQKTTYIYPTTLPRTASPTTLLSKPSLPFSPSKLPISAPSSPSKALIYTDAPTSPHPSSSPGKSSSGGLQLKEIHINVNRNSEPPVLNIGSGLGKQEGGENRERMMMAPPPLKRHATMESRLPKGFATLKGVGAGTGREKENARMGVGAGRRLRNSPPG